MTALAVTVLGWCESVTVRLAYYADALDTYVQTKAGAARYRNGAGRTPSKEEMNELHRLARHSDLVMGVEPEFFDYLAEDHPPNPDPKLTALFRSMRGQVEQR